MAGTYSRNVWVAFIFGLLLLFFVGFMISTAEQERAQIREVEAAEHKLKYLAVELKNHLQQKNYEFINDFLQNWGNELAEVNEVSLTSKNGFVLGHYKSTEAAEHIKEYQEEISYSYKGKATLKLRISEDEILAHGMRINAMLVTGFTLLAVFLYFMLNLLLRLRQSSGLLQQENKIRKATELALQEREQELQMTLYSIGDGIIATNADGKVTHMNPVAEKLTGWSEKQARGRSLLSVFNIINAQTREPVDNPVDKVLLNGEIVGLANHTVLVSKQGVEYQIADSAAPIKNVQGAVFGAILVFRDVTEEYRIQQELSSRENVQQQMLNGMMTFLAILDAEANILFVNKPALDLLELDLQQAVGKKLYDIGCWDYSKANRLIIKDDLEKSLITTVSARDIEAQIADGSLLWIDFHVNPIHDENGKLKYLIAEGRDITQRKNAEEQLRRSQKMEALGKLTGGIAHDFNNILGIITGYAEMLAIHLKQQPKLVKYVSEIQRSGERGARLTKKLLAISRNQQSETEIINLNDVLNDQLHMLEKTLTPKIRIIKELDEDVWLTETNRGDLEDAILNVCINAMQAMPGSGTLTLSTNNRKLHGVDAETLNLDAGEYIELSIADTGTGMDEATQARIFDPFFTTKDEGTGLGLSQVYGFVQSSGGAVKVYSELGRGSRIILLLPRKVVKKDMTMSPNAVNLHDVLGGDETILVVDDEAALRNLAQEMLTAKGYKVFVAESAVQAIEVLQQQPVELMLCDVIMPGMDGYGLANLVQQQFPGTRIQMLSGFSDDRHLKVIDEKLHAQLIKKPYKSVELLRRIRSLLDEGKAIAAK